MSKSRFSKNLKTLRDAQGLTQEALSEKLGVAKSTISMYENGNREPSFEIIEALADIFNVNLTFLMGESQPWENDLLPEEARLIVDYRRLSARDKAFVRHALDLANQRPTDESQPKG